MLTYADVHAQAMGAIPITSRHRDSALNETAGLWYPTTHLAALELPLYSLYLALSLALAFYVTSLSRSRSRSLSLFRSRSLSLSLSLTLSRSRYLSLSLSLSLSPSLRDLGPAPREGLIGKDAAWVSDWVEHVLAAATNPNLGQLSCCFT